MSHTKQRKRQQIGIHFHKLSRTSKCIPAPPQTVHHDPQRDFMIYRHRPRQLAPRPMTRAGSPGTKPLIRLVHHETELPLKLKKTGGQKQWTLIITQQDESGAPGCNISPSPPTRPIPLHKLSRTSKVYRSCSLPPRPSPHHRPFVAAPPPRLVVVKKKHKQSSSPLPQKRR